MTGRDLLWATMVFIPWFLLACVLSWIVNA